MFDKKINKEIVNIGPDENFITIMNYTKFYQINCSLIKVQNITKIAK